MNKVYIGSRTLTLTGHPALRLLEKAGLDLVFGPHGKRPSETDQLEHLPECVAYLAGTEPISEKVLRASKKLGVISRNGVGIENINLGVAEELGIEVKTTPGSNTRGVAELTIALMMTAIRSIPLQNNALKSGVWERIKGAEIENSILGVIGCGNIGKEVSKMALGLGMRVIGYDLFPDVSFAPSENFIYAELQELFTSSDIVSLHVPPADKPFIDGNTIAMMKNGVIIINTARAEVVNDEELIKALDRGKVACYATDVYTKEPPGINTLITHPKTICTPHIGAYTEESVNRAAKVAVDNILEALGLNVED